MLLWKVKHNPVKLGIKRDLAGQPAFRRGPFGELEQIGFHAAIRKPPDPVDPGWIDVNMACGTGALAPTIAVDARNFVEQRRFARRHANSDFNRKPATIVGNKGDLHHKTVTFPWRIDQCA